MNFKFKVKYKSGDIKEFYSKTMEGILKIEEKVYKLQGDIVKMSALYKIEEGRELYI